MSLSGRYSPHPWYRRPYAAVLSMNPGNETTAGTLYNAITQTKTIYSRFRYSRAWMSGADSVDQGFYGVNCDEVYPNIFIGDGSTAKNKAYLKKLGITHVLNTAEGNTLSMVDTNEYFYRDTPFKYLGLQLLDLPTTKISVHFNKTSEFIDDALMNNGKVYVHCLMGMSRSSTCVIAYLMMKRGMSAADAIRLIRQRRDIYPNEGFLGQLAELDNYLRRNREMRYSSLAK